jgi:hypothetical protein
MMMMMMMMPLKRGDDENDDAGDLDDPTFSQQPQQQPGLLWVLAGLRTLLLFDSAATPPGPSAPCLLCLPSCLFF